jgi:hypothetical protein
MDALSEVAMASISTLRGPIGGGGASSRPDASASGDGSSPRMSSRHPGGQSPGASSSHCMHAAPHKPAWAPLMPHQPTIPCSCVPERTHTRVCLPARLSRRRSCAGTTRAAAAGPPLHKRRGGGTAPCTVGTAQRWGAGSCVCEAVSAEFHLCRRPC